VADLHRGALGQHQRALLRDAQTALAVSTGLLQSQPLRVATPDVQVISHRLAGDAYLTARVRHGTGRRQQCAVTSSVDEGDA